LSALKTGAILQINPQLWNNFYPNILRTNSITKGCYLSTNNSDHQKEVKTK
jgi:hypothetical protein